MNALPRISVVTPSFNQGQFIEQTILSVLDQGYPDLEYIVMDGGSTDGTLAILKQYEDRITLWVSEKDRGQSHAINKGLAHCTGQVFNWLNSDDFLEPGALHHIGEAYARQPFTALCCRTNVLDGSAHSHVRKPSHVGDSLADTIARFNINQEGTWWALDAVKTAGGVNESLHFCMDLNLWFRVLLGNPLGGFRQSDAIVSNFRRHADAKSTVESGREGGTSGFVREQLVLFNALRPDGCSWDWFELMAVAPPTYRVEGIVFDAPYPMRAAMTERRLFELARRSHNDGDTALAKVLLKRIGLLARHVDNRDLWYLRRKLLSNWL